MSDDELDLDGSEEEHVQHDDLDGSEEEEHVQHDDLDGSEEEEHV